MEVLQTAPWYFGQANVDKNGTGLTGQLSKCRHDGVVFYVRENVNQSESFLVSSGERWGDKTGARPSKRRQVLEISAPMPHVKALAVLVAKADALKRPVLINRRFTAQWAEDYFKEQAYKPSPVMKAEDLFDKDRTQIFDRLTGAWLGTTGDGQPAAAPEGLPTDPETINPNQLNLF